MSYKTRSKTTLYHVVITKYSRNVHVPINDLMGALDFLKYHSEFIYGKFHRDGLYKQLHYHAIVKFSGRYSKLKYPTFNIRWNEVTPGDLPRVINYINKHKPKFAIPNWQNLIQDENYLFIKLGFT